MDLARKLKNLKNVKVAMIPSVVGALGMFIKNPKKGVDVRRSEEESKLS